MTARRCCEGPEELQTLESMSHSSVCVCVCGIDVSWKIRVGLQDC